MHHVDLSFKLDAIIVIPATANILCKAANGVADEIVSTTLSICDVPILFAPAMNFRMWNNEGTMKAVQILKKRGNIIIEPEEGALASLHQGKGRLAELNVIMNHIRKLFNQELILENKTILITAGPTQEPIDPVRFITNRSSGKMGYAIAKAAKEYGGKVTLISGPVAIQNIPGIKQLNIKTANEMNDIIKKELSSTKFDFIFMAAAVADYSPANYSSQKIKSNNKTQNLKLDKNIDIMTNTISKYDGIKVAFSLETEDGENNALQKMKQKKSDYIILNYANEPGAGFDEDTNHVYVYSKDGENKEFAKNAKVRIAKQIIEFIINNEKT